MRRVDMWIAAVDALVVLTLGATLLLVVVLTGFADEHASHGQPRLPRRRCCGPACSSSPSCSPRLTGRVVFWWLEPHPRSRFRIRGHLVGVRSPWRHVDRHDTPDG